MTPRPRLTAVLPLAPVASGAFASERRMTVSLTGQAYASPTAGWSALVASLARAGLVTRFTAPLAVGDAPVELTVHADVTTGFRSQSGTVIHPSTAHAGGAPAELVSHDVRRSFRAFRDDDRNGRGDGDDHAHA